MKKFFVEVIRCAGEDDWNEIKYQGNKPEEAIALWAELEREYPTCVSISVNNRDDAYELIKYAYDNMEWLEEICSKRKFPYKWKYIQDAVGAAYETGCESFHNCPYEDSEDWYRDMVHPFDIG